MRFEPPDEDAYGRVTNPDRYQPVVAAAREMIDGLSADFDVAISRGTAKEDFATWLDPAAETMRLEPAAGAPLRVLITDFPGVVLSFGRWGHEAFPSCGCDACDEDPDELIAELTWLIEAVTSGAYVEELNRRTLTRSYSGPWGRRGRRASISRNELADYGPPGRHEWEAWPRSG